MINAPLVIPPSVLEATIRALSVAGERNSEGIVLWLGRRSDQDVDIVDAFVPEYESARDYFRISPEGMSMLFEHMSATGTFVASQVHSHPREAFHSLADDKWAIVRHRDALSIVLPDFAMQTSAKTFLRDAAIFRLDFEGAWNRLTYMQACEVIHLL